MESPPLPPGENQYVWDAAIALAVQRQGLPTPSPADINNAKIALAATLDRADRLEEALQEVWQWIGNWDPNFIHDEEWPATARKIRDALDR